MFMKLHSRDRPGVGIKTIAKGKTNEKYKKPNFGGNNIMLKKTISIVLVVVTLFSIFAVTASAASYSTGYYVVSASNGINVRTGAGTGYSRVGAASKNVKFYVSKVSGSWGYTSSIQCTNGTRSGWVSLDYCSKQSSGHTHNYNGGRYYQNAHPHQISVRCTSYNSCGGWKWTGENYKVNGCSQCYPTTGTYYTLSFNANGGKNTPSAQRVRQNTTFAISSQIPSRSGYSFLGWSTSKSASSPSFYPNQPVSLSANVTLYAVWKSGSIKTSYSTPLSSGTKYYISPACATGSVLDVDGGNTSSETNLQIWQKANVLNQQFEARHNGSGYYYFVDVNSGLAIDVSAGIPCSGQNVQLYSVNKSDAQLFRLISAGNGYYYIQSKLNPAYYLDVENAHSSNGTNVHLYVGNYSIAQKFKFTKVSTSANTGYATYNGVNYESILKNALSSGEISKTEYNNRISVLTEAKEMVTVLWTAPVSFHTWKSSSGSYNSNKKMVYKGSPSSYSMFVKGVTYQGIPYAANAGSNKYNDYSWNSLITKSEIKKSDLEGTVNYLGTNRSQCTSKGVDCSGFVYNAYKTLDNYKLGYLTTSGLLKSSSWKKINSSSAMPGDILLKSGHVMIYVGKTSSGKIAVMESTADGYNGFSGCRYYEFNSVSGYDYYRFTGIAS